MTFVFPTEQRVLTAEEYASLGYIRQGDLSQLELKQTADKPLSSGYSFPAYRAETKEEYVMDLGLGLVKLGHAVATGGVGSAVQTTLGYTWSLLN